jgi:hypothetical protein
VQYVAYVDLGAVHDPTVIAVGHEEAGVVYVDRLLTYQGSREHPVQLSVVETALMDLHQCFSLHRIRIESWQGLSAAQRLQGLGLPVQLFTPTAKSNAEEWPMLAQRLAAGTLVVPTLARLREELLNLVAELGPQGVKVSDKGKVHQDHAVAVRGVVAQLGGRHFRPAVATIKVCAACGTVHPSSDAPLGCSLHVSETMRRIRQQKSAQLAREIAELQARARSTTTQE